MSDAPKIERWELLLTKLEQAGSDGLWVEANRSSQEWQDLKAMAQHGIVFPCGLRAGGNEAGWYAYNHARNYLAKKVRRSPDSQETPK